MAGGPTAGGERGTPALLGKRKRQSVRNRQSRGEVSGDCAPQQVEDMQAARAAFVGELRGLLQANANPSHAVAQAKYLKNLFPCFGLYSKRRRELAKEVQTMHPIHDASELFATVDLLWSQEERDFQHVGCDLLQRQHKLWPVEHATLALFETYITQKSWWDTVDCLASNCVGLLLKKDIDAGGPLKLQEEMDDWIRDDNMWKRRTALLHQLKYKTDTDECRLFNYCEKLMHEKEFFIRKAIGWALRQHSRSGPAGRAAVAAFVAKHRSQMAGLSLREASKYL